MPAHSHPAGMPGLEPLHNTPRHHSTIRGMPRRRPHPSPGRTAPLIAGRSDPHAEHTGLLDRPAGSREIRANATDASGSGIVCDQAQFPGPAYGLGPLGHAQLGEQLAEVMAHAVRTVSPRAAAICLSRWLSSSSSTSRSRSLNTSSPASDPCDA